MNEKHWFWESRRCLQRPLPNFAWRIGPWTLVSKLSAKICLIPLALCSARLFITEASVHEGLIDVSLALPESVNNIAFSVCPSHWNWASSHVASAKSPSTSPVLAPSAR